MVRGGTSGCYCNVHGGVAGRLFSCERMEKLVFECVGLGSTFPKIGDKGNARANKGLNPFGNVHPRNILLIYNMPISW